MASSHYLNQCWNCANSTLGRKFQWNLHRNLYIFIQENSLKIRLENDGHFVSASMCWYQKHIVWVNTFRLQAIYRMLCLNSLSPRAAYKRRPIRPSLVLIMACRLSSAKALSEPLRDCCRAVPQEQTLKRFKSKYDNFHSIKYIWKCL